MLITILSQERKKGDKPLDNPPLSAYRDALQQKHPGWFRVMKSIAGERAGLGLFFSGRCFKGEMLVGYSGNVGFVEEGSSHYSLQCGSTKWCINATTLGEQCRREEGDDVVALYPLGHMVNRPGEGQKGNCRPHYQASTGLLFLKALRNMDTQGKWVELLMPYNDCRV